MQAALDYLREQLALFLMTVVSITLGGASAVYRGFWKKQVANQQRTSADHYVAVMRRWDRVYDIIEESLTELNAHRLILLSTHNGGGLPVPGALLRITAMGEVRSSHAVPRQFPAWQGRPASPTYLDFLMDLTATGLLVLLTDDMEEGTELRTQYEAEGVVGSVVRLVGFDTERCSVIYLAIELQDLPDERVIAAASHVSETIRSELDLEPIRWEVTRGSDKPSLAIPECSEGTRASRRSGRAYPHRSRG